MNDQKKQQPPEYLVIGHLTEDLTPDGPLPGGTAYYSGLTVHALGLQVGILSANRPGTGFQLPENIQIIEKNSTHNTRFRNIQTGEGRTQFLFQRAENLTINDIPSQWRSPRIVHLGPVADEVDPKIVEFFPDSLICLTPQGWMRTWDSQGKVRYQTWKDSAKILRKSHVACLSLEDVQNDEDIIYDLAQNISVLAVTEGQYGARVYWNGDVRHFNTQEVKEVDVTGAGDIFAAAFFFRYYSTRDPWESARFANNIASASVQRKGIDSIPDADEVKKYKQEIIQNR